MYFLFDILSISGKIGAHTVYKMHDFASMYFHGNIYNVSTAKVPDRLHLFPSTKLTICNFPGFGYV